jgi:hypothetical protein
VEVDVDGRLVKPWVTWFVDAAHNANCGTAVTPGYPSRESILAALRASILRVDPARRRLRPGRWFARAGPHRPGQGLPVEHGGCALGAFAVRVTLLPAYTPHLKGTVETLNGAVERMLFAGMPRYTHAQTLASGARVDPDAPPLRFEAFVAELLNWTTWWNTEHEMDVLDGQTPASSWLTDPSPITEPDHRGRRDVAVDVHPRGRPHQPHDHHQGRGAWPRPALHRRLVVNDLYRLRAHVPPQLTLEKLASEPTGTIARLINTHGHKASHPAVVAWFEAAGPLLSKAAKIRNPVLHARPSTTADNKQEMFR